MAKTTKKTSLTEEELALYANYIINGKVESEEDATKIEELSQRSVTLSDATIIARLTAGTIGQQLTQQLVQVMEVVQIQGIVLEKLGANSKIFKDAKVKYNKQVDEAHIKLQEEQEKLLKDKEEKEEKDNA